MIKRIIYIALTVLIFQTVSAQRPSWAVNESLFTQNETMICSLNLNGVNLTASTDMVAAFVGTECRGVTKPVYIAAVNKYLAFLVVFSNTTGDSVTFKIYDSKSDKVVNIDTKLVFKSNDQVGSYFQSLSIAYPKLSSDASLLSFDLPGIKYDSLVTTTDLLTGLKTFNYYVPFTQSKENIIPKFTISNAAHLYLEQQEIISGTTPLSFKNKVQLQVLSQDESTLKPFYVNVLNISDLAYCKDSSYTRKPVFSASNLTFCQFDSTKLTIANFNAKDKYYWYVGNTVDSTSKATKYILDSGLVRVLHKDSLGCMIYSDSVTLYTKSAPNMPKITRDANNFLVSSAMNNNTWYKDAIKMTDTTTSIKPTVPGNYSVKNYQNGCYSKMSAPYYYILTDVINLPDGEFIKLGPNPFQGLLNVQFLLKNHSFLSIDVHDMYSGRVVYAKDKIYSGTSISLENLSAGTYLVRLYTEDKLQSYQFKVVKI